MQAKPLLLVDIDGVLSLFEFDLDARPPGRFEAVDGVAHFISATAGEHLLALSEAFELVWCSGWEEKANEYLPGLLGLPGPLPYLSFGAPGAPPPGAAHPGGDGSPGPVTHWKLAAIDAYAGDRPLAWIDDSFNDACSAWALRRPAPTLLVACMPATGLLAEHVAELLEWAPAQGGRRER